MVNDEGVGVMNTSCTLSRFCFAVFMLLMLAAMPPEIFALEGGLRTELVITQAINPIFVASPPASTRLFVVEQAGQIRIFEQGALLPDPFLNITSRVTAGGERGLLGLAFHPEYQYNGLFFVYYTTTQGNNLLSRISRFNTLGNPLTSQSADHESEFILLEFVQPVQNHNAGMIAFGPNDGYLYIASGDGGSSNDPQNVAQNLNSLLGKMLRIDVDTPPAPTLNYTIPPDNPFVNTADARPEIWSYGLRNPWRFSFDRQTGDMYIGDVGQNAWEEINFQLADSTGGENYGWRVFEGSFCNSVISAVTEEDCLQLLPDVVMPVHEYPNPDHGRSVTGGYVYRGSVMPEWNGVYFFTDYLSNRVWSFRVEDGGRVAFREHTTEVNPGGQILRNIVSFGEDAQGELYLVSLNGDIWRFTRDPATAPEFQVLLSEFDALDTTGDDSLSLDEVRVALPDLETRIFSSIDLDNDGRITRPELLASTTHGIVHGLDRNVDGRIDLQELLRVVQLYNSGELHCDPDSEDGYAPGAGIRDCLRYPADTQLDWQVNLGELLRVIQLYNSDGYRYCPDVVSEDGYCFVAGV